MIKNNKDVEALLALAVSNNRGATISALTSAGYTVNQDISDADLFVTLRNIWAKEGIEKVETILKKVPFDVSKLTPEQARNLAIKYKDISPNEKFNLNNIAQSIGDFFSGTTEISQNPGVTNQYSEPLISPTILVIASLLGISAIVFLYARGVKNANAASIAIGIVLIGLLVVGGFAKKVTTTQTGTTTSQTVHNGALGWLQGVFQGLNISLA